MYICVCMYTWSIPGTKCFAASVLTIHSWNCLLFAPQPHGSVHLWRSGPGSDPCGTPEVIYLRDDHLLWQRTLCTYVCQFCHILTRDRSVHKHRKIGKHWISGERKNANALFLMSFWVYVTVFILAIAVCIYTPMLSLLLIHAYALIWTHFLFSSLSPPCEHRHSHTSKHTRTYTWCLGYASSSLATAGTGGHGWNCAAAAAAADDGWDGRSPICRAKAEICCPDISRQQPSNSDRSDWHSAVLQHERCLKTKEISALKPRCGLLCLCKLLPEVLCFEVVCSIPMVVPQERPEGASSNFAQTLNWIRG